MQNQTPRHDRVYLGKEIMTVHLRKVRFVGLQDEMKTATYFLTMNFFDNLIIFQEWQKIWYLYSRLFHRWPRLLVHLVHRQGIVTVDVKVQARPQFRRHLRRGSTKSLSNREYR